MKCEFSSRKEKFKTIHNPNQKPLVEWSNIPAKQRLKLRKRFLTFTSTLDMPAVEARIELWKDRFK